MCRCTVYQCGIENVAGIQITSPYAGRVVNVINSRHDRVKNEEVDSDVYSDSLGGPPLGVEIDIHIMCVGT